MFINIFKKTRSLNYKLFVGLCLSIASVFSFAQATSSNPTQTPATAPIPAVATTTVQKPVLNIQHWQTHNGAKVLFVETHQVPMLDLNVVFAAGGAYDGNKPGIAQFTAGMLNEGAGKMNADQIAAAFDDVGAIYSSGATRDMTILSLTSLTDPKYLRSGLDAFTTVLTSPTFPEDAFLRTQKQTLTALQQIQQSPDDLARNAFFAALYPNLPYGHPTIGDESSIKNLKKDEVQNFYKQYYVGKNALVTIVGDVTRPQAEQIAEATVGKLPEGVAANPIAPAPMNSAQTKQINFPSAQTQIFVGQVGINYQNPNYFPLMVGNYVLGGAPLTSRLFTDVRETRGLAYGVGSGFVPLSGNGPFLMMLSTRNQEANKALGVARTTLQNFLSNGPTDQELTAAKNKIINGFPLTFASNDAISGQLMQIGFYNLPLDYLDTYRAKVGAITREQVIQAYQSVVRPSNFATIMVGDFKSVAPKTATVTKPKS